MIESGLKSMRVNQGKLIHKPKILIVDDKPENLLALERLLADMPVLLYKATSGNDALKLTLHHEFALALLDIQMPEMDGYELAELLRMEDKTEDLPFIFISAIYTDAVNVFKGYKKGAFSYITKPFEPEVLISKVRFFIEKYQQEQKLKLRTLELERSNEELESFSYSVSHDLRAPLRAINGYTNILLEDHYEQLDTSGKEYLEIVRDEATRMGELIDNLLSFSRQSRKVKELRIINMNEKVATVWQELLVDNPDTDAKMSCDDLIHAYADEALLHQVWINLLENAIKYRKEKQTPLVKIGSYIDDENGHLVYFVKDNGVGFNAKYADKLFGVFQRLHTEEEFKGTGIGLALVRQIVTRHGGNVWADSEPDKGSTFYFSLPTKEQQEISQSYT